MKSSALNKIKITLASVGTLFALLQGMPQAQALTLSPPRLEVTGEPGQLLQGELEIYNEELVEKTFYVSAQNFEARGETGSPYFLPNDGSGLASWVSSEGSITLAARERTRFPYSIQVPQTAQPGGYFAAVFFGTTPVNPEEGGQVTIGGKVGTLIFLNVPGAAKEGAGILDFITDGGKVLTSLPVAMSYRFSNDGARKVMPMGTVEVKDLLGNTSAVLDANASLGNVLPGSVRKFQMSWEEVGQDDTDKSEVAARKEEAEAKEMPGTGFFDMVKIQKENFAIGKYTANLGLKYGEDQKDATAQVVFYVLPWQLMSLVTAAVVILVVVIILLMKGYKRKLTETIRRETQGGGPKAPEVNTISEEVVAEPLQTAPVEDAKTKAAAKKSAK